MSRLVKLPDAAHKARHTFGFFDDFTHIVTGDLWTKVTDVDGTALVGDAVGGQVQLIPAVLTVGNNEQMLIHTTAEIFKFAEDKPVEWGTRLKLTEANTDDANVLAGLTTVVDGTALGDNGAGPPGTYDGVVFFKVDGSTTFQVEDSFATTQKTTELTAANALNKTLQTFTTGVWFNLRALCQPISSTLMDVEFYIDDVLVAKHKDRTMTSPEEMHFAISVMSGGTTDPSEILDVDYAYCFQTR